MNKEWFRAGRQMLSMLTAAAILASCGGGSDGDSGGKALTSDDSILRFVPVDSPYVVATPGEMPDDLYDKVEPQIDATLKGYHRIMRAMAENAYAKARDGDAAGEVNDEDVESLERLLPVITELESLMSVEGLESAGIDRDSDFAFYGHGVLPVLRMSLSDGAKLEDAIARLESRAQQSLDVAEIDGQSYRYLGDEEGRVVIAVIDEHIVIALVPTDLSDDLFKDVLGLELPAQSIADSGVLAAAAAKYGFNDFMIGMLDVRKLADIFTTEQSGLNAEVFRRMHYDTAALSDVCKSEIRSMAAVMPRLVTGYTHLSEDRVSSNMIAEMRTDIASEMTGLTGAVPGLGEPSDSLFSYGMGINLQALRDFYSARLDALEAEPYQCELFAELQSGVASGRQVLNQPVPPLVYGFKGFLASVESIEGMDIANQVPPTSIEMRALVAIDNAQALLGMAAMFSPDLAAMNLQPDGEPVKLALPQIAAYGMDVFMAMSDDGLGVAVGEEMADELPGMLAAPVSPQSPFLHFEMDSERYYGFIADMMDSQPTTADSIPEVDDAIREMMLAGQDVLDRAIVRVLFTDNGVEVQTDATLQD